MKKIFSNSEVPHIWARQSQDKGKGSNIFFDGKEIYSYGRHFCMGRIVDSNTVLLTDRTYSNTTARHLHAVRYAVNHFANQIYVPYPESKSLLGGGNANEWERRIKSELAIIGNARKRPQTKDKAKGELLSIVDSINKFCEVIDVKVNAKNFGKDFWLYYNAAKDEKASEQLAGKLERIRVANEKAVAKQREERIQRQREYLNQWVNGKSINTGYFSEIENVYLRRVDTLDEDGFTVTESNVESSKGASVSERAAKVLFEMIKQGKDIKGFDIDGYTVIGINGVLTIGCHKIERTEINRFAKLQGWGEIPIH